ncbi:MAG: J domain-containing protein [Acidobacteria bacterium]|nr:J domain-containing protein [Acidobacteriota bacterium]
MVVSTSTRTAERRNKRRDRKIPPIAAKLWFERFDGSWQKIPAEVININDGGFAVRVAELLRAGQSVLIEGGGIDSATNIRPKGLVAWCAMVGQGEFHAGIALDQVDGRLASTQAFEDHYEILEVHPSASFDTIHKIYRILAQRLHPDNPESGNDEAFKRLLRAFQVLSDPEKRAAFDVVRTTQLSKQYRIFDAETATPGLENEQRKRKGVLALLYTKRLRQPDKAAVSLSEMEQLLAVPREHLEFPLWYLREQGWIARSDNGQFTITAKGVEQAESTGSWQPAAVRESRLIAAALA